MRVLHIITSLMTGGAEVMLEKVVSAMRPLGYEATVVSLTGASRIGRQLRDAGVQVVTLEGKGGILLPGQLMSLARTYRLCRPQVVHCWMYHSNLVGHAVIRLRNGGARPVLVTSVRGGMHMLEHEKTSLKAIRRVDSWLSRRADAVLFNSERSAQQHAAMGYCMSRAKVIPNCFDADKFRPRPEEAAQVRASLGCGDSVLIGLVARFGKVKDQHGFLEAARLVLERVPNCRFLLAGRGCDAQNRELAQWVRELGLGESVLLLGERSDVAAIQSAVDVAVSSSLSESFPNAVGEAMACGTPCVVTDVGDSKYLVGDTGLAVPPRDPAALAKAIVHVIELPEDRRRELGARARQRIVTQFSMESIVKRFIDVYEDCIRARERGSRNH